MSRAALVAIALTAACATGSEVGPYVKNVAREGAWLAVQRCTIIMEGDTLREGTCSVDHVPLAQMPMGPPAPMGPAPMPPRTSQAAQSKTPTAASIEQTSSPSRKRP